jgi:hypothetical protein
MIATAAITPDFPSGCFCYGFLAGVIGRYRALFWSDNALPTSQPVAFVWVFVVALSTLSTLSALSPLTAFALISGRADAVTRQ